MSLKLTVKLELVLKSFLSWAKNGINNSLFSFVQALGYKKKWFNFDDIQINCPTYMGCQSSVIRQLFIYLVV